MTNTTPYEQAPEALIDLIDAYAETRHRFGRIHNARTKAARKAVIEALSGVQALSAGPMVTSELRRLIGVIADKIEDGTLFQSGIYPKKDLARFVRNMLDTTPTAPAASPTPPAEQQAPKETLGGVNGWRDISTAPKDGSRFVATGHNYGLYSEVRHTCVAQWFRGCWMEVSDWNETSELKYLTHWMPLPSPPDDVAAPAEQQAAPKAAPGVGNSGFDYKTAADFLNGKTVSDEAVRKFVATSRWAHDERAALSATLLAMHGVLTSREAEIALLKKALLEAETAPQPAPNLPERDASLPAERQGLFRKFVVGRVDGSDKPGGKHHGCTYFVLDVDHDPCARPALAAYAAACESTHPTLAADLRTKWGVVPAPQPAPAPLSDDVVKDAARYRWLREGNDAKHGAARHVAVNLYGCEWDAAIDAALAAQRGN